MQQPNIKVKYKYIIAIICFLLFSTFVSDPIFEYLFKYFSKIINLENILSQLNIKHYLYFITFCLFILFVLTLLLFVASRKKGKMFYLLEKKVFAVLLLLYLLGNIVPFYLHYIWGVFSERTYADISLFMAELLFPFIHFGFYYYFLIKDKKIRLVFLFIGFFLIGCQILDYILPGSSLLKLYLFPIYWITIGCGITLGLLIEFIVRVKKDIF